MKFYLVENVMNAQNLGVGSTKDGYENKSYITKESWMISMLLFLATNLIYYSWQQVIMSPVHLQRDFMTLITMTDEKF
jgi:hypothetical protein